MKHNIFLIDNRLLKSITLQPFEKQSLLPVIANILALSHFLTTKSVWFFYAVAQRQKPELLKHLMSIVANGIKPEELLVICSNYITFIKEENARLMENIIICEGVYHISCETSHDVIKGILLSFLGDMAFDPSTEESINKQELYYRSVIDEEDSRAYLKDGIYKKISYQDSLLPEVYEIFTTEPKEKLKKCLNKLEISLVIDIMRGLSGKLVVELLTFFDMQTALHILGNIKTLDTFITRHDFHVAQEKFMNTYEKY